MIDDTNPQGWRARVQADDIARGSLAIVIGRQLDAGQVQYLTAVGTGVGPSGRAIRGAQEAPGGPDLLHVEEPIARALYDALAEHYGHAAPGRHLRLDYDAERRRVDKLTDAIIAQLHAARPGAVT